MRKSCNISNLLLGGALTSLQMIAYQWTQYLSLSAGWTLSSSNCQFWFGKRHCTLISSSTASIPTAKEMPWNGWGEATCHKTCHLEYLDIESLFCGGCPLVIPWDTHSLPEDTEKWTREWNIRILEKFNGSCLCSLVLSWGYCHYDGDAIMKGSYRGRGQAPILISRKKASTE